MTGVITAFGALGPPAEPRAVARGRGPGVLPAGPHVVSQCSVGRGVCRLEGPRGLHVRDKGPAPRPLTWAALKGSRGCHPLSQAGLWMSTQPGRYAPAWGLRTSLPGLPFLNSCYPCAAGGDGHSPVTSLKEMEGNFNRDPDPSLGTPSWSLWPCERGVFFMGRGPKPTLSWEGPRVDGWSEVSVRGGGDKGVRMAMGLNPH